MIVINFTSEFIVIHAECGMLFDWQPYASSNISWHPSSFFSGRALQVLLDRRKLVIQVETGVDSCPQFVCKLYKLATTDGVVENAEPGGGS